MRHMDLPILAARTRDFIRDNRLVLSGDHVLVAVSGGPDSIALLHVLLTLRDALEIDQLTVVHFDHRLRAEASAEDSRFVEALAARLKLPFRGGSGEVQSVQRSQGVSLEMAARICRYGFFRRVMDELAATRLALGHTADDQAEELLLRLLRGTGPAGMAGMGCSTQDGVIRPLLFASRSDIVNYIHELNLDFRYDMSNFEAICQRNSLRLEVMPLLRQIFHPAVDRVLGRHAQLVQEEESYWAEEIARLLPAITSHRDDSQFVLQLSPLRSSHPALLRRLFRSVIAALQGNLLGFYAVHFELLEKLVRSTPTRKVRQLQLPQQLWVVSEAQRLVFRKGPPQAETPFCFTISEAGAHHFPHFSLELSCQDLNDPPPPPTTPDLAWMDAAQLQWPLTVRSWHPGDRFQPLGMRGSKKLQDFFTDCKIPRAERSKVVLLCDAEKICWVVGYRLDERVRVTRTTRQLLIARFYAVQR